MTVCTASIRKREDGTVEAHPTARVVLLKGFDQRGFVFYTNYNSKKSSDLKSNPRAAVVSFALLLKRALRLHLSWHDRCIIGVLLGSTRAVGSHRRNGGDGVSRGVRSLLHQSTKGVSAGSVGFTQSVVRRGIASGARWPSCGSGATILRQANGSKARVLGWLENSSREVRVLVRDNLTSNSSPITDRFYHLLNNTGKDETTDSTIDCSSPRVRKAVIGSLSDCLHNSKRLLNCCTYFKWETTNLTTTTTTTAVSNTSYQKTVRGCHRSYNRIAVLVDVFFRCWRGESTERQMRPSSHLRSPRESS